MPSVIEYMALILHGQWIPDWGCSCISFYPLTQCHMVGTYNVTGLELTHGWYTNIYMRVYERLISKQYIIGLYYWVEKTS